MNNLIENTNKIFEDIKHIDENGNEYWCVRELQIAFEYKEWRKFNGIINKAIIACNNSNINSNNQFVQVDKLIKHDKGGIRRIKDYKLNRYECYLIAQNSDSHMKVIALAQTYFTIQTRRQELADNKYNELSENKKRINLRKQTRKGNLLLNKTAKTAGVKNFDKFHNSGYKGLYNGETANDIAKRKGLRYREDILDNMSSEELGGTMPQDLPTPKRSLKGIEKKEIKQ